jgi:hypothetical protein
MPFAAAVAVLVGVGAAGKTLLKADGCGGGCAQDMHSARAGGQEEVSVVPGEETLRWSTLEMLCGCAALKLPRVVRWILSRGTAKVAPVFVALLRSCA